MEGLQYNIEIFKATIEEKEILKNLLALYLHDLSRYTDDIELDNRGFYEYDSLEMYFQSESLIPLLYKINNEYAGFILLNKPPYAPKDVQYNLNEFFILNKHRGKGIAKEVVKKFFEMYPGKYIVLQLKNNIPAIHFWHKVYDENHIKYDEDYLKIEGESCLFQKFTAN